MVCWWQRLHDRSWQVRWPIKWATLVVVTLIVCFPYPRTLLRHLAHARNPNLLIEPDAPALAPLLITLRPQIRSAQDHHETLRIVQQFVHETIPYAFDWETWGVVDYLPTVEELLSKKREDCDGRAVLAASLLRNLGYEANLVTDGLQHVGLDPARRDDGTADRSGQSERMTTDASRSTGVGSASFRKRRRSESPYSPGKGKPSSV